MNMFNACKYILTKEAFGLIQAVRKKHIVIQQIFCVFITDESFIFYRGILLSHIPIVMKNYNPSSALTLIMVWCDQKKAFNMYHQDTNKSTATDLVRVDYRII